MVKYDRTNKDFKGINALLEEIMQRSSDAEYDDISLDDVEAELSEASDEQFEESIESSSESIESTSESIEFTSDKVYNFGNGQVSVIEQSEDFPIENDDMELKYTIEELAKLSIVDRPEYKDSKNIMKIKYKSKKNTKRCSNVDD